MLRRDKIGLIVVVTGLAVLLGWHPAIGKDHQDSIKIGVLAKRGPERCLEKWDPTAKYLTEQIPGHSFVIVPLGFEEVCPAVERGEVDFILSNPSFYVEIEVHYGANRLATLKNLRTAGVYSIFGGVVFRRADRNDIQDLDDLKGKTFMAVEETSFGGWYAAWRKLKERRIDPHHDFRDLVFGGTHDAVVYAVRDGKVDAGTVRTDTLERMAMEGKINLEDFRVLHDHMFQNDGLSGEEEHLPFLHSTRAYPEWPFVKVKHTSDNLAQQVAVALLSMPADSPAAKAARCAGWTVPLNYQPVHECLKELRLGPYEDFGKITLGDVLGRYWPWIVSVVVLLACMSVTLTWALRLLGQRKQAEEKLREGEKRLKTIFDTVQAGIVVVDAENHVIVDANPAALEMIRASKEQVVGNVCHKYICPAEVGHCPITDLGELVDNSESVLLTADGQAIQVLKTATSLILNGREHLLDCFVDLTEHKRAKEQLRITKEMAEAANSAKSEFLANMSHEIRTPMTAILGFADILLERGNLDNAPPERIEAAKTIKRNGEHLLDIINDILDISKIEAGKMTLEPTAYSPHRLVAEVASLMRVCVEAKRLAFNVEYIGAVPEMIRTDPMRLRQILINLIGNAIKFTQVGGVRLVTRFVDDALGPLVQFDILDTGFGMTEEQVVELFEPFTQADISTSRKYGGTGLGLAICKRLAQILGGDIAVVETQEGLGTRFRVTVPTGPLDGVRMIEDPFSVIALDTEGAADFSPRGTAQAEAGGSSKLDCRILFAEDSPDNQRLISHVLRKAGAEVTVVENGKLALDAALAACEEGRPFDVILMDIQMPVMDGYEATRLLRRKSYTSPIIALTAHAMEGDREKCLDAGCDDYAAKPIDRNKLIATIRSHLPSVVISV